MPTPPPKDWMPAVGDKVLVEILQPGARRHQYVPGTVVSAGKQFVTVAWGVKKWGSGSYTTRHTFNSKRNFRGTAEQSYGTHRRIFPHQEVPRGGGV